METKTVIIIGRSPFVTQELLNKIQHFSAVKIAINQELQWCDYIAHLDRAKYNYGNAIPLTSIAFDEINSPEKYNVTNKNVIYDKEKNALHTCGFTHDFCVSWAIYKGFDKIILAGAADFIGNTLYNSSQLFNPKEKYINESINYINSFNNVYTLNPDSKLSVKRILL